jgi:hypothetical protein
MLMTLMLLLLLDLGLIEASQAVGESGGEESEEDEWNYIKVDDKKSENLAPEVSNTESLAESPIAEEKEEPVIETGFNADSEEPSEENVSCKLVLCFNET